MTSVLRGMLDSRQLSSSSTNAVPVPRASRTRLGASGHNVVDDGDGYGGLVGVVLSNLARPR